LLQSSGHASAWLSHVSLEVSHAMMPEMSMLWHAQLSAMHWDPSVQGDPGWPLPIIGPASGIVIVGGVQPPWLAHAVGQ